MYTASMSPSMLQVVFQKRKNAFKLIYLIFPSMHLSVYPSLSRVFIACNYFQDRNDFTPVFEKSAYTADELLETVFPGTPVLTVKATDGDPEVSVRHVWRSGLSASLAIIPMAILIYSFLSNIYTCSTISGLICFPIALAPGESMKVCLSN